LCQHYWWPVGVPASEENVGEPGGTVGGHRKQLKLGLVLDRVRRLIQATEGLLGRLIALLALPSTLKVVRSLGRLVRCLLAFVCRRGPYF